MDTSILDVFADGITLDDSMLRHSVDFDFLGTLQELRDHHRMFLTDHSCILQRIGQFLFVGYHTHGCTREHIGRTYHDGQSYLIDKVVDLVHLGQLFPSWLIDTKTVAHLRELLTVFSDID